MMEDEDNKLAPKMTPKGAKETLEEGEEDYQRKEKGNHKNENSDPTMITSDVGKETFEEKNEEKHFQTSNSFDQGMNKRYEMNA